MNILLVYPEMPDNITNCREIVKLSGRKASFPPVGLLTVAAMLPLEWNKKIVDLNTDTLSADQLEWADYVFISAMNVQAKSAIEIINICNEHNKKVVAGGPLFTHEYEHFPGVDHFVLNEAEITLPQFLNDLRNSDPKHIYKSSDFADVHQTPVPMWELIDLSKYLYSIVQYSRGCPYLCDFCDVTALYGRKPRTKTPEQIIKELDEVMSSHKTESILFADDNLIGNKKLLKSELLPALIEWRSKNRYAPAFATQLTITLADDKELCKMMLEAGFRHVLIGIESIEEESLIAMRKKQNVKRDILENIKYLQSIGFVIIGTFIVGLDTDKRTVFDDVINFIRKSGIVYVIINVLKAPPGTELYERMKRENRLLAKFEFDEDRTNIVPVMDVNELHEGYKKVLRELYSPENVLERIKQYYTDKNNLVKTKYPLKRKPSVKDIYVLLNIVYHLGIRQPHRRFFWKVILFTIKYNYRYLDHAFFNVSLMHQYMVLWKTFLKKEEEGKFIYSGRLSA